MRNCRAFVIETAKPPGVAKCGPISRLGTLRAVLPFSIAIAVGGRTDP